MVNNGMAQPARHLENNVVEVCMYRATGSIMQYLIRSDHMNDNSLAYREWRHSSDALFATIAWRMKILWSCSYDLRCDGGFIFFSYRASRLIRRRGSWWCWQPHSWVLSWCFTKSFDFVAVVLFVGALRLSRLASPVATRNGSPPQASRSTHCSAVVVLACIALEVVQSKNWRFTVQSLVFKPLAKESHFTFNAWPKSWNEHILGKY